MNRYSVKVKGEFKAVIEKDEKDGEEFHLMKGKAIIYLENEVEKIKKKINVIKNTDVMPNDSFVIIELSDSIK
jgi:predicted SpoU family rRNA methylase